MESEQDRLRDAAAWEASVPVDPQKVTHRPPSASLQEEATYKLAKLNQDSFSGPRDGN